MIITYMFNKRSKNTRDKFKVIYKRDKQSLIQSALNLETCLCKSLNPIGFINLIHLNLTVASRSLLNTMSIIPILDYEHYAGRALDFYNMLSK